MNLCRYESSHNIQRKWFRGEKENCERVFSASTVKNADAQSKKKTEKKIFFFKIVLIVDCVWTTDPSLIRSL